MANLGSDQVTNKAECSTYSVYHKKPASFLKTIKRLSQKTTVLNPPQVVYLNSKKHI